MGINKYIGEMDEIFRLGSPAELEESGIKLTSVVTGNIPLVARESLLPMMFWMEEKVIEKSIELFGRLTRPFYLETIVIDQLEFKVFEISTRIVARTNPYTSGSPYSDLTYLDMSTGRRIAIEIKRARDMGHLLKVLT